MSDNVTDPSINRNEHIEENVQAKRVIPFGMGTDAQLHRLPVPLLDQAYDYVGFSSPDANGNYTSLQFKNGGPSGTLIRTLTLAFDGNSNVTSIARS